MSRSIFATVCFFALTIPVHAQVSFASIELKELFNRLPELVQRDLTVQTNQGNGKKLHHEMEWGSRILTAESYGTMITNLGLKTSQLAVPDPNDSVLFSFAERVLLRLSFEQKMADLVYTAEALQIQIYYQNKSILFAPIDNFDELFELIRTAASISLEHRDNYVVVKWQYPDGSIAMVFPNNFQLITGKNRIELDADLHAKLQLIAERIQETSEPVIPISLNDSTRIRVVKGADFMDHLHADVFYGFTGSDSVLVFDPNHLAYSTSNLLLRKELAGNRLIEIRHSIYGEMTSPVTLTLNAFLDYFENDFDSFVGLESCKNESIEGTLVLRHSYFDFIHLIHFKADSTGLFSDTGRISADLLTHIPIHNLDNLFMETAPDQKQPKIDVHLKNPKP